MRQKQELVLSFNEHPFRNEPNARLICSLNNGTPLNPKVLWNIMNQLKKRVKRLLENGEIESKTEESKLTHHLSVALTQISSVLPLY